LRSIAVGCTFSACLEAEGRIRNRHLSPQKNTNMSDNPFASIDDKLLGIISYITPIGLIISVVGNKDRGSEYVSFHIRQALGIFALSMLSWLVRKMFFFFILSSMTSMVLSLAAFVLWIIALVGAAQEQTTPVPVVGDYFQDWFRNI